MRTIAITTVLSTVAAVVGAQPIGTAFTYQGRLTDAGNPATAAYDLQLALFDAATGGAQVGSTLTRDDVVVANGLFTVSLDFGAVFAGSKRWLEIRVRPGASTGAYTTLAGRQELTPSPNAAFASAVPWSGVANKPAGFADDIDNDSGGDITSVAAGFGLTGGGTTGSVTLNANVAGNGSATTLARSDHDHFAQVWNGASSNGLTVANASSTGVGLHGQALATSGATRGVLGESASVSGVGVYGTNASGGSAIVGRTTATAGGNAVVGITEGASGIGVTGAALTSGWGVYGSSQNTSGTGVGVYGRATSPQATAGFFENSAGGPAIVLGGGDLLFSDGSAQSTAAHGGTYVVNGTATQPASNFNISGNGSAAGTLSGNIVAATTQFNIGPDRVLAATAGAGNTFAGLGAGTSMAGGIENAFFGRYAGEEDSTGGGNSFFGFASGRFMINGSYNSFFGSRAGAENLSGNFNSFFGHRAGEYTNGSLNSFFGTGAGLNTDTGSSNTFIGHDGGNGNLFDGSFNTTLGENADVLGPVTNATAIGSKAIVTQSNSLVLGSVNGLNGATADTNVGIGIGAPSSRLHVNGIVTVNVLGSAGSAPLCRNAFSQIATCSSSIRYKRDTADFGAGLDLVARLRPVTFRWRDTGEPDLGLVAEDVAAAEPLLVTRNRSGEIEGVKYDRVAVVLLNAVREQQQQIAELRREIESLQRRLGVAEPGRVAAAERSDPNRSGKPEDE